MSQPGWQWEPSVERGGAPSQAPGSAFAAMARSGHARIDGQQQCCYDVHRELQEQQELRRRQQLDELVRRMRAQPPAVLTADGQAWGMEIDAEYAGACE
jgi:hypothetical protein